MRRCLDRNQRLDRQRMSLGAPNQVQGPWMGRLDRCRVRAKPSLGVLDLDRDID
jgi:hypothetical protein